MSSTGRERARILVVADDPHLRRALNTAVEGASAVAIGVRTLRAARERLREARFDAMILDATLPDGSGLALLEELRSRYVHLHVLIVSGELDAAVANRAHFLGASCVFKPDIAANVRMFVHRSMGSTADATQRTMAAARKVSRTFRFTARERQVVELVALGVTRDCLAKELGVKENTIKTLIRRMLAKCDETRLEGLVRTVLDEVLTLPSMGEPI